MKQIHEIKIRKTVDMPIQTQKEIERQVNTKSKEFNYKGFTKVLTYNTEKGQIVEIEPLEGTDIGYYRKMSEMMNGINKLEMTDFNEDIAFYAFRYALGRKTYAVKDVVDYLIQNWGKISARSKELIFKEINQAIAEGQSGMHCDTEQWQRVIEMGKDERKIN